MSVATVHADMRAAIRARLLLVSGMPAIAWEGRPYTPTTGVPFARETLRPANSTVRALGRGGTIQHTMTAFVVLFYPTGEGTSSIEAMAGAILNAFAPGVSLVHGQSSGMVQQAQRRPLLQEPSWLSCPIEISLTAYTVN